MTGSWTRRRLLKVAAGSSAAVLAGGARPRFGFAQEPTATPAPTPTPTNLGQGDVSLTMWVQDFGPAIDTFRKAAEAYIAGGANVSVTVQPIAYEDFLAKVLPSVAAGNEADILMGYTDWYVATDITRLFLPLDEYMGARPSSKRPSSRPR